MITRQNEKRNAKTRYLQISLEIISYLSSNSRVRMYHCVISLDILRFSGYKCNT